MALKKNKQAITNTGRKLIAFTDPKSPISEQYRTIRTNILFSSVDEEIRTLMVTSSGPSEGKSTTAANLAVVFAQQKYSVLLVDADLRKPTMHYTFNEQNTIGMTNVLTKRALLKEAVKATDVENLHILTSGPIPPNPSELLGSNSMKEFLEEAKEQYQIVIFDTPPVLAVTDAQILANSCDGTVLVVNSERTVKETALKSKELLESVQAKLLGVVLNKRDMKDSNYYYYYGN